MAGDRPIGGTDRCDRLGFVLVALVDLRSRLRHDLRKGVLDRRQHDLRLRHGYEEIISTLGLELGLKTYCKRAAIDGATLRRLDQRRLPQLLYSARLCSPNIRPLPQADPLGDDLATFRKQII